MSERKLALTGLGACAGETRRVFHPRLNNAYEQKLYHRAVKETGLAGFDVSTLATQANARQPFGLPQLTAVEGAARMALTDAGLQRRIGRKLGARIGVLYADSFGPTSFMATDTHSREVYYADIFPTFLLKQFNIAGFSLRLRGERNLVMEALALAFSLIDGGELDIVLLGGVYPCHSYLFLSETLDNHRWSRALQAPMETPEPVDHLAERCLFAVLESEASAQDRKQTPRTLICEPRSYTFESAADLGERWQAEWRALSGEAAVCACHGGVFRDRRASALEQDLLRKMFPAAHIRHIAREHGDSGGLNPLLPLLAGPVAGTAGRELIHSFDRNGLGWNLIVNYRKMGER